MKKGYTIIELLIVMAIIVLLASLSIPQFTSALYKNRVRQGLISAVSIRTALEMYKGNYGGYPLEGASGINSFDTLYTKLSSGLSADPRNNFRKNDGFVAYNSASSGSPNNYTLVLRAKVSYSVNVPITATPKSVTAIYNGESVAVPY